MKRRKRDPAIFNQDELAKLSAGFSGAEIEQVVVEALAEAFTNDRDIVAEDLSKALRVSVPLSKTMREEIDNLRSWAATRARPASTSDGQPAAAPFSRKVEI